MRFAILTEDFSCERSAMVVTAEDIPSALFTIATEMAKNENDLFNECIILPLCDESNDANETTLDPAEEEMIRAYAHGCFQLVNLCDLCIRADCEPGLCHTDEYCMVSMERCKKEEMQKKQQITLTMGTVFRVAQA